MTKESLALLARIGSPAGLCVLELGCGDGELAAALLAGGCASYLGIDASASSVAAARARLDRSAAAVVHGSIERFAPPRRAFDLIVARAAPVALLAGYRAALRPAGRLLLSAAPGDGSVGAYVRALLEAGLALTWLEDEAFLLLEGSVPE